MTDPGQLRQVVVELVMNAVEAIGEGSGGISVRSTGVEIDEEAVRRSEFGPAAIPAGQYVTLEVRDTGCGMDEETQARIFDPFFTTRFLGRGLGLAAVHGFVRSHGGGVQVESSPGRGTMFRVLLPAAAGAATRRERYRSRYARTIRPLDFQNLPPLRCDPVQPSAEECLVRLNADSLHDLMSPVNQMCTMTDLILKKHRDSLDDEAEVLFGFIQKAANRLQNLLSGLRTYMQVVGPRAVSPLRRPCSSGWRPGVDSARDR